MDPPALPPISTATATATAATDSQPPILSSKLRLMCSYGGHIIPRPHDKSLSYAGGDTRIVAMDRCGATLSSLTVHLAAILFLNRPFTIKYQLPGHDLDSLVSVATDEDFENMLDEYDRITNSPNPSRLRLFLFPAKPSSAESILGDSESESWFLDALRNTKIIAKERYADSGTANCLFGVDGVGNLDSNVEAEAQTESLSHGGGEGGHRVSLSSAAESIVLETSSSFGSTSSSVSMSNLPPIRVHVEDSAGVGLDMKVKLPKPDSIESDKGVVAAISHPQPGNQQQTVDNRFISNAVESETNIPYPSSGVYLQKTVQVTGYPLAPQLDQQQPQQELQYVPTGAHYISPYPTGPLPVSSYYPMYHPQLQQQQQQYHYQPNQPYPIYVLPVGQTQAYNFPMHGNLVGAASIASSQLPMQPNTSAVPPQVAYQDITTAPPMPVLVSKVCRTGPEANPLSHVASDQNQQQFFVSPQMHHPPQSISPAPMATANYSNEIDDDPAVAQIYKTQPPAPVLPPQYQTMTKATADLLSEAFTQLHTDNIKQQI